MNELKRIAVFSKVVEASSFSEAARRLGVAKSAVSKQVSLLEDEVGIRLLNRTTRRLSLTEAGQLYYKRCTAILEQADFALNELKQYQSTPSGTLRIACPVDFGTHFVVPIIVTLNQRFPDLKVDLVFEDKIVNMVEEGIDLAIRVGWLQDSNFVARKLCDVPVVTFASPCYIKKHGEPKSPKGLQVLNWISLSLLSSPLRWDFFNKGKKVSVQMHSNHKSNSVQTVVSMVGAGLGISAVAKYVIAQQLKTGELVAVLPEWQTTPLGVYVVYPHRHHVPSKVRVFIDLLLANFQAD